VGDIKEAGRLAYSQVLFDNPGVLDRHIPTAKIDHPRTKFTMDLVQRGFFHGLAPYQLSNDNNDYNNNYNIQDEGAKSKKSFWG
jgi:hypothetical protein